MYHHSINKASSCNSIDVCFFVVVHLFIYFNVKKSVYHLLISHILNDFSFISFDIVNAVGCKDKGALCFSCYDVKKKRRKRKECCADKCEKYGKQS